MRDTTRARRWGALAAATLALALAAPGWARAQPPRPAAPEDGPWVGELPAMPDGASTRSPITVIEWRIGDGEQCLVCRTRIYGDPLFELRYQGRVFHVDQAEIATFLSNPDYYFSRLQARSALFDEGSMEAGGMASGWLFFGLYVLLGLIGSAVTGYLAVSRNLRPIPWFFAGLFGNVVAIGALLAAGQGDREALPAGVPHGLRKVPTTREPVSCLSCGGENHPAAKACSHCGTSLSPSVTSEVDLVRQS